MKKNILKTSLLVAIFVIFPKIGYATTKLPEAVEGKITLTENIELVDKYEISKQEALIIDLNGFNLIGPLNNYAIDSQGTIKIIDSQGTGKVVCNAPSASCVRNDHGKLEVEGITMEGAFVLIKTEPDSLTNIKNSTLISTYTKTNTGAILNWGTTTIEGTSIKASETAGIYASSGVDEADQVSKNSETSVKDCVIDASRSIYAKNASKSITTNNQIHIDNVTFQNGPLYMPKKYGAIATITGEIKYPGDWPSSYNQYFYPYTVSGARLVPTSNIKFSSTTINEGVTLVINEEITASLKETGTNTWLQVLGNVEGKINNQNILDVENHKYWNLTTPLINTKMTETKYQLLNSISGNLSIERNIDLDLNGHAIEGNIELKKNTIVTIEDTSEQKFGRIEGILTNNGNLTIKGGTFMNLPITTEGATTTLLGGTYSENQIEQVIIPDNMEWILNEDGTYSLCTKATLELENPTDLPPTSENTNLQTPPKTMDNIAFIFETLIVSVIGLIMIGLSIKEKIRYKNSI